MEVVISDFDALGGFKFSARRMGFEIWGAEGVVVDVAEEEGVCLSKREEV